MKRDVIYSSKHAAEICDLTMPDIDSDATFTKIFMAAREFTMTRKPRMFALYQAVKYIHNAKIAGDLVECGVWKGGSSIVMALTIEDLNKYHNKKLYLYDTYDGMSEPTNLDVDSNGISATEYIKKYGDNGKWVYSPVEEVLNNFTKSGVSKTELITVKGRVEETTKEITPIKCSLVRLDTDFYESTKHELEHFWPLLTVGGCLIIDDYGDWRGAKQATDEFFKNKNILLNRIDESARLVIKTQND